jgi:nucleotide-binding universal stress UspA family protein
MAKNILLALDNSKNSMKAVKFVANGINTDASITMLSILPDPTSGCGLDGPSLTPIFQKNKQTFCGIEEAKKVAIEEFLGEAKKILVKAGFPSKNIAVRVRKKKSGIARDILKEARRKKYDTIVVGRRGLTGIKQFLFGSVSNKIVQLAENASVIVVD